MVICGLELVERESLKTLFFFLNRPMFEKESIMWSVTFSCVCLLFQIVICASYDITLLQIVCHSHSIIVEMLLS